MKRRTLQFDRLEPKLLLDAGVSVGPLPNKDLGPYAPPGLVGIPAPLPPNSYPFSEQPGDYLPGNPGLT